jgi:hypothetical protein
MKKQLIIDFNNVDVCLSNLHDLSIKISDETKSSIIEYHEYTHLIIKEMPIKIIPDICFRVANKILSIIEKDTNIKFVRYKLLNYKLC